MCGEMRQLRMKYASLCLEELAICDHVAVELTRLVHEVLAVVEKLSRLAVACASESLQFSLGWDSSGLGGTCPAFTCSASMSGGIVRTLHLWICARCHRWQLLKDARDWVALAPSSQKFGRQSELEFSPSLKVAISALGRAGLWEQALDTLEAHSL